MGAILGDYNEELAYRLLSSRCDTEKGEMGGKRHWTDNREWCQQLYSLRLLALSWPAQAEEHLQGPPLTPLPPHQIWNVFL